MEINFELMRKTPVFSVPDTYNFWSRVFGATRDIKGKRWFFPAFPPFLDRVLHDFDVVNHSDTFSLEAQNYLKTQTSFAEKLKLVRDTFKFSTSCYSHQITGLAGILHNYRYGLDWEMGTGKTKVLVDAIRYWNTKVLVLCPVVALDIWEQEAKKHSDNTVQTVILRGPNKEKLLEKFQRMPSGILAVSYGVARTQGIPTLYATTAKIIGKNIPEYLKKTLSKINDPKLQAKYAQQWTAGKNHQEIQKEIASLTLPPQWVIDADYDVIIADESHRIKRIQSAQTKAALQLSKKATRRYILSGTMNQGDPRDMYPQMKFLAPYILQEDYRKFCEQHVMTSATNKHIVVGFKHLDALNRRVTEYLDKKKLEECIQLPGQTDIDVRFDLSENQIEDYNYVVKNYILSLPDKPTLYLQSANRINKLFQISSGFVYSPRDPDICDTCDRLEKCLHDEIYPWTTKCIQKIPEREVYRYLKNPKLEALKDLLEDILEVNNHKILIWAHFKTELDDIEKLLTGLKIGYVRVDGSNTKDIQQYANKLQSDKKCRVYLGQIHTGIAVTLTAAAYSIYYSRSWMLDDWLQSRNRNYRIGQNKKVIIYRLIARKTVEEQQIHALDLKQNIAAVITEKINCLFCEKFQTCLKEDIKPWTTKCTLDRQVYRPITKARKLKNAHNIGEIGHNKTSQ